MQKDLTTVVGEVPIDAVTLAMLLECSDVAHGSLDHHEDDFADLIETAAVPCWQCCSRTEQIDDGAER